ncbi:hypothetical protein [Microbacterium sp.]|uniref:hypothetical protein n=1 Tax=Microbacterium sp. TaxID=51671 RepID=UPI003736E52D
MTLTPPDSPVPTSDAAPAARTTGRGRRVVTAITDKVPTRWLTGILTVPFLAVTAAFGGLNAVAAPPIPDLAPGEAHENGPLAVTVERAVLIDTFPEAGISVDEGQRVLAVVFTAENRWDRSIAAFASGGPAHAVRIAELGADERPESVARMDDATTSPYLHPEMPVQLVATWAVDSGEFEEGDELVIELQDFTLFVGTLINPGEQWTDPAVGARVALDLADVGAGADSDAEESG